MATFSITSESETDRWLAQVKQHALLGGMLVTRLDLAGGISQYIVVTQPVRADSSLADELFQQEGRTSQPDGTVIDDILLWVQPALEELQSPTHLSDNHLVVLLDLSRYREAHDPPHIADGLALRRAIRQAVDAVADLPGERRSQLVRCFRMRFEHAMTQREVADDWSFIPILRRRTERKLARLIAVELAKLRKAG
ncbi:MAG: hypothetical protein M1546_00740 [Chloroflexi bacterium]|nr:hypothetical protein [Chloroflexota bacterium]